LSVVLVVDDSKVMRDMIEACLRPEPSIEVLKAASGLEAIERMSLTRHDLLVLDLNMPDMGGLEVVQFMRSQDTLKNVPILIVTTRGEDSARESLLAAGANRFLTKPFQPEALLAEVRALLESQA
jgi:two-component system, chemotaxis family, chemotaxis protein CheY